jgi:hypothetical protein
MKIIRKCKECGWYNISNPTNYTHQEGAFCAKTCRKLSCVEIIPDWCPLEDIPIQMLNDAAIEKEKNNENRH